MRRLFVIVVAVVALALTGWLGLRTTGGAHHGVSVAIPRSTSEELPITPAQWRGQIDYLALDRQLAALVERPEMTGLAVAIVENGKLTFVRTYGVTDVVSGAPVTPHTLFRWASVSKTATGVMAATLAKNDTLDLDRPVGAWRTSLRLPDGAEARISLADLLSQRTGLTKNAYDDKLEDGQNSALLRRSLATAPVQCAPGTCHTYQNIAFDAASEILSESARQAFADAVEKRLFLPLGMVSAKYGMTSMTGAEDWARPHRNGQIRPLSEAYWRVPAAAGVESNIIDFATWMRAMMGERPDVLPEAVLEIAHLPRVATQRPYGGPLRQAISNAHYGLGWRRFSYDGHDLEGHSGAVAGYRSTMIFEPATRTGVVAFWNSDWGFPFRIPFAAIDSYHKRDAVNWLDLSEIPSPGEETAKPDNFRDQPGVPIAGSRPGQSMPVKTNIM